MPFLYLQVENDLYLRKCNKILPKTHPSIHPFLHPSIIHSSLCPSIQHFLRVYCVPELMIVVTKMGKTVLASESQSLVVQKTGLKAMTIEYEKCCEVGQVTQFPDSS